MNWFVYTIAAMLIYGFVNFMYKVAAANNCPSHKVLNKSAITVSILSYGFLFITKSPFTNLPMIFLFALFNSTFFALGIVSKIISLKKAPSSIIFPITKINSLFLIVFAIVIFKETPHSVQWIGISLSFATLVFISLTISDEKDKKVVYTKKGQKVGIFFAVLAALSTSVSMLVGKLASTRVPLLNYMAISYSFVVLSTWMTNRIFFKDKKSKNDSTTKFGIITGVLNFSGYYCSLKAVSMGSLALIQGITSNVFIIPVVLSVLVYKEKFDLKKLLIIFLTVISIFLIRWGS